MKSCGQVGVLVHHRALLAAIRRIAAYRVDGSTGPARVEPWLTCGATKGRCSGSVHAFTRSDSSRRHVHLERDTETNTILPRTSKRVDPPSDGSSHCLNEVARVRRLWARMRRMKEQGDFILLPVTPAQEGTSSPITRF